MTAVPPGEVFLRKADAAESDADLRGSSLAPVPAEIAIRACSSVGLAAFHAEATGVQGTFHAVFRVATAEGPMAVKVRRPVLGAAPPGASVEVALAPLLDRSGVRHPALVGHGEVDGMGFSIARFVSGVGLDELDADDAEAGAAIPALLHELDRAHAIVGVGFGLVVGVRDGLPLAGSATWDGFLRLRLDDHRALLRAAGVVSAADDDRAARALGPLFPAPPDGGRLLHGDCGPHNAILEPDGRVSLLDWEDSVVGDPLFDLAMWATFTPSRRWPSGLPSREEASRFWRYFLRISLAKSVVRVRWGIEDRPGRSPAAARIGLALAAIDELDD